MNLIFSRIDGVVAGVSVISLIIVAALLGLAFEVWMLVDLIKNDKLPTNEKVLWAIGMFLVHPVVALVYFFSARSAVPPKE